MFDIGFWELIVLGAVALIVVGPEQMPGLIKTVLSYFRHFQRQFRSIRDDVERELNVDALQAEHKSLHELLENDVNAIKGEFGEIKDEYQNTVDDAVNDIAEADRYANAEIAHWDDPDRFEHFDDSEQGLPDPEMHADTGVDDVTHEKSTSEQPTPEQLASQSEKPS